VYPEVLGGCKLRGAFGGLSRLLLWLCGLGAAGAAIGGGDPFTGEVDLALYGHWCFPGFYAFYDEFLTAAGYGEDHCRGVVEGHAYIFDEFCGREERATGSDVFGEAGLIRLPKCYLGNIGAWVFLEAAPHPNARHC